MYVCKLMSPITLFIIGFNVETLNVNKVSLTTWDLGGGEKLVCR